MRLFLFVFLCISLSSCQNENDKNLENFISKLPSDTSITINTYEGSNQVVHPDVQFRNNVLYLAITPYPYYVDSVENPSLYTSIDGINFKDYRKGINPLVKAPPFDHNSDPDILFDKKDNLYLFYLETLRPFSNKVVLLKKTKGEAEFKRKVVVSFNLKNKEELILSPGVANNHQLNKYFMYYVEMNKKKFNIQYMVSNQLTYFNKKKALKAKVKFPDNYSPWHLDVIATNDKYYLLTNGFHGDESNHNYSLFLAESDDLINWKNNREILTDKNIPDKNLQYVYRSSGLIQGDTLALWYSYVNKSDEWKLAFKKMKI